MLDYPRVTAGLVNLYSKLTQRDYLKMTHIKVYKAHRRTAPRIASSSVGFAFSGLRFCSRFALGKTVRCVAGLDDAAVVGNPIQQGGGHFCIAEHRHPFAELEVCGDDDAGRLIQLADQMKQQRPARFWEWDIAEFVDDDAIQSSQLLDDFPWVSLGLLCDEGVDQIDGIVDARHQ